VIKKGARQEALYQIWQPSKQQKLFNLRSNKEINPGYLLYFCSGLTALTTFSDFSDNGILL